jgi:pseudouridine-5'-phosphate glycosidase
VTGALLVSDEVRAALDGGRPVVALETSVLSHGLPGPWNARAAEEMDAAVRDGGAIPAWVWTDGGAIRLGASDENLRRLVTERAAKVARRDLPLAASGGGLGGTTVSAMVWAARQAGIELVATGGIGGVHVRTGDVSADLAELARTAVTVVCSGPKSILDPAATVERLEELGVAVAGYRTDRLPFFVVADTGIPLEHRFDAANDVAAAIRARRDLGIESALLVCQQVPAEAALPGEEVSRAVSRCLERATTVSGKAVTPFLLSCLAEETGGSSLHANLALLRANAGLAAQVAAAVNASG